VERIISADAARTPPPQGATVGSRAYQAWLFAQRLRGITPRSATEEEKRRQFVAAISDRPPAPKPCTSSSPSSTPAPGTQAYEAWLFAQKLLGVDVSRLHKPTASEVREQERLEFVRAITEGTWDPAKHPRGAFPQNRGWFSPTWGPQGAKTAAATATPEPATSTKPVASPPQILTVSDKSPKRTSTTTKSSNSVAPTPAAPAINTKAQLPADHRGTWIRGTKGDGVFQYNNSVENQKAGIAGKEIRYKNQHIAVGGFPAQSYYGGSAAKARVEIGTVTGSNADNIAADAAMRKKLRRPNWQRPKGFVWNHAGSPGSSTMELVKENLHKATAHKGAAAEVRAQLRSSRAQSSTSRALSVLTVYLMTRDALQYGGLLKPTYEVGERETYRFEAEDGSVFVVWPAGFFSSAQIEFVEGPRKGQKRTISNDDVEDYRKQAEKIWGKYIPGTWLSDPRFIPGTKRQTVPYIIWERGLPREIGFIDERGVHIHAIPVKTWL
jgi:hypothetical protein